MNPYLLALVLTFAFVSIVLAFTKLELQWPPHWNLLAIAAALLFGLGVYGLMIFNAPPTNGEITEEKREKPEVIVASSLKEKLAEFFVADSYPKWAMAGELAQCSSDAYLEPVEIESRLKKRGYQDVTMLNTSSLIGYVAVLDETAVVVFRGTIPSDFQNWLVNLDTRSQPTEHGPVHAGFWSAYGSLHDQLTRVLQARNTKRIWITGHSLGGAMAAICGYRLSAIEDLQIAGLMTFGQPKVGSRAFCDHMNRKLQGLVVYFVNESDVVARVPPNFDQFGSLVWYTAGGIRRSTPTILPMQAKLRQEPGDEEEFKDADYVEIPAMSEEEFERMKRDMKQQEIPRSSEGELVMQSRLRHINDHDIEQYIEKLK